MPPLGNYMKVSYYDVSNGPGVRVSIFLSGCSIRCKGCFNPSSWNPLAGSPLTPDIIEQAKTAGEKPFCAGFSILGGEPTEHPSLSLLIDTFKQTGKSVWVWSGKELDEALKCEGMNKADVVVAGPFIQELADKTLLLRGSSNQCVYVKDYGILSDEEVTKLMSGA